MQNIKNSYLVLDFECKDKYIGLGYGGGYVYKYHYPEQVQDKDFKVLGWAIKEICSGVELSSIYRINTEENRRLLKEELKNKVWDGIIMHGGTYDLGCLLCLGWDMEELQNLPVLDTLIISRLYDNRYKTYGLEELAERYLSKQFRKGNSILVDRAIELELVQKPKRKEYNIERFRKGVEKWCKSNMDILQENCFKEVAKYACMDADCTWELFKYMINTTKEVERSSKKDSYEEGCL